jgi:ABC-type multidrug transport system fused ATPase/permease subunit
MSQTEHTRDYAFRPPPREETANVDVMRLYWRFVRAYVWPRKWSVLICIVISSLSAGSVYLMSFYGRVLVDSILVIRPNDQPAPTDERTWAPERNRPADGRPTQGMGKRMDLGFAVFERPPGAGQDLLRLAIAYIATQLILDLMARVSNRRYIRVSQGIVGALREDMHRKVLQLQTAYHQSMSPGRLLSRIVSDVGALQDQMMYSILATTRCATMIIAGTLILLVADWRMAFLAFMVTPLFAFVYHRAQPGIRELSRQLRHTNSCMYGLAAQKMDAVKAIQAYSRERHEELNFHRLSACFLRDALYQQRQGAALGRSATIITSMSDATIFILGALWVLEGKMTLGEMLFVRTTTMNLFWPVVEVTGLGVLFGNMQITLGRVVDILDRPVEITDAPDAVDFPSPLKSGIEIRDVAFAYAAPKNRNKGDAEGGEMAEEPVLKGINLTIPVGTWLCVMGASGCGKTTLLYLLSRLYEPQRGEVLVDGVPLNKIRMNSLRRSVGVVPQEAQIFSGSVRDNIAYGVPGATPAQIMAASKAAQLHEFVLTMKVQYETLLGQRGTSLSGGQRQRLSLARALLTNPDVLVLDDCTSALDADTERRIQETLAEILVGKTAVIVSQRVSMASRCHRICTIENGVISEYGTHAELVQTGGFYARLHAQQTE